MYSRKEIKALHEEFWTALGAYLAPIPSASGEKVNWINYKTGIKGVRFNMQCKEFHCMISIDCQEHKDTDRQSKFQKFRQLKPVLEEETNEPWEWEEEHVDEFGQISSRIVKKLEEVRITNRSDWPELISFFKERMLALDRFWTSYKAIFEL